MLNEEVPARSQSEAETRSQPHDNAATKRTPIPKFQLFILLLIQFAEPMTALVIYPPSPSAVERPKKAKNTAPTETDPLLPVSENAAPAAANPDTVPPLRELLTRNVRIALLNHALLSFCDMAHDSMMPLVFSTPISLGGLGLKPYDIGLIMGLCGISNAIVQVVLGGQIIRYFGPRRVFIGAFCAFSLIFSAYPLLNILARRAGRVDAAVLVVLVCQLSGSFIVYFSFAATMLFIMHSAPNRASVGSVTGLSQMVGTVARSVAPSIASSLFALSAKHNLAGGYLVYIVLVGVACCAVPAR
ncbi:Major facilitator superfamily multidrug-resistance DHA1 sub-family [Mycena venus]|uniref:Major facilitator superfamily multidrug-resistance DHA1 sub-family n=1 Tax=Mycena venus TaxID=2733690 RepID=A0A8H6WT60_9AGAR|nr:Major facilitator superfamily multidrug-resistance DHA1 sub-family [Mycena venus]